MQTHAQIQLHACLATAQGRPQHSESAWAGRTPKAVHFHEQRGHHAGRGGTGAARFAARGCARTGGGYGIELVKEENLETRVETFC